MLPTLIGCPFDNGIQTMLRFRRGVTGAADAPEVVLSEFNQLFATKYNLSQTILPLKEYNIPLTAANKDDAGLLRHQQQATETAQQIVTASLQKISQQGHLPISIGGDHSLTYPLCRGVHQAQPDKQLGLIYIDAHLDMRPLEQYGAVDDIVSSGNSFRQLIKNNIVDGQNMVVIGIHPTQSELFWQLSEFASQHGATIIYDYQCKLDRLPNIIAEAVALVSTGTDGIYLSVDIDSVQSSSAPGVSAVAQGGLTVEQLLTLVRGITHQTNVVGFDVVEVSSRRQGWQSLFEDEAIELELEVDKQAKLVQTAILAAQVIDCFLSAREVQP
ncbi:arginase family protein [Anaerolineales bacterium HSG6]|nr:arginase family protein [Anaerolineales bacterium HSG6]MDM8530604.1 arginase family protein [Anaerolineales bacterium HSG25]